VNEASVQKREMEHQDNLESIQEQIEEVRRDVEASRRVHQLLQNELDVAHSELKTARSEYDKYNREVNLQRFDWVNSGSLETFDRLKPVYDGFEELQASSKAKTDSEEEIEEMYQTLARDFINLYEQEMDGGSLGDEANNPIANWVTKVFGSTTGAAPNEPGSGKAEKRR